MGIGSWLSRYFERQLVAHFLRIELLVGLIGGLMPTALFALQTAGTASFRFALYALVLVVGILVGLEIPLVMRILKRHAGAGSGGLKTRGLAGADLRLPRRARRLDRLSAAVRAAARADPHRRVLRPAQRRRRGLGAVAVPRRDPPRRRAGAGLRPDDRRPRRRLRLRRPGDQLGRGPLLRRPRALQRDQPVPADRRHHRPRRGAPVPQRQPAVPLARRVPLPRGPGASGALGGRAAAPGAGARRRRRHGDPRDPQVPERRAGDAGRARSAHDARCSRPCRCCAA